MKNNKVKNNNRKNKDSDDGAYKVVYSTDPIPEKRCPNCNQVIKDCICQKQKFSIPLKPSVRIERKGRGGKTVTLIEKLPLTESILKDICVYLKKSLGTGGTYYIVEREGVVEIQGDRREEVLDLINRDGAQFIIK